MTTKALAILLCQCVRLNSSCSRPWPLRVVAGLQHRDPHEGVLGETSQLVDLTYRLERRSRVPREVEEVARDLRGDSPASVRRDLHVGDHHRTLVLAPHVGLADRLGQFGTQANSPALALV